MTGFVWTGVTIQRMCALLDSGLVQREIAAELGVTASAVSGQIARLREAKDERLPVDFRVPDPSKRNRKRGPSHNRVVATNVVELPPRVVRDPCYSCGTRMDAPADMGCARCRHMRTLVA